MNEEKTMSTLLEKAKEYQPKEIKETVVTDEEVELMLALLRGEIELLQARKVNGGNIDCRFRLAILKAYKDGLITIV